MRVLQMFARQLARSLTFVLPKPAAAKPTAEALSADDKPKARVFERVDPDDAEYRVIARHVADLMLADEWVEIGTQVAEWEEGLEVTPGGLRFHEIAVDVALSGLQSLLNECEHTSLDDLEHADYELSCFFASHVGAPDSHVLAALAARAYLIMGEACRADHWPDELRTEAWRRMAKHYVSASEILEQYDARALMSPLVAEAKYLAARGAPSGGHHVPELFEEWIALDPSNPRIYAIHAEWLADPENAPQDVILALADEAITRTEDTLGLGGYALFFRPLLTVSEDARTLYDAEIFASGILDLATLSASQADANRAADALAEEISACGAEAPEALKDTLFMLIQNEIQVVYPTMWSRSEDAIRSLIDEAEEMLPGFDLDLKAA